MTNNADLQNQFQSAAKQAAEQSGISGAIYLDFDPSNGFMRIKFKVTPVEQQAGLVSNLAYVIIQMSQAFGLQTNVRERKNGEGNNV